MVEKPREPLWPLLGMFFKSHPWHGVAIGPDAPEVVMTYIEMVPTDTVKYELDKLTGHLKVDRPQMFSNFCPALYGLIPQTYCAEQVGAYCARQTGRPHVRGDGDPLDICVLTEKPITHGDILLKARPIGGLRLLDGNEADDKILAILHGDAAYGHFRDLGDCPAELIDRLRHYFLTYKDVPGSSTPRCEITHMYGVNEAHQVIHHAQQDYRTHFADIENKLMAALHGRRGLAWGKGETSPPSCWPTSEL